MADLSWLKTIVPAIGTALGGPLGGAAASFIADKLGIGESTVEAVTEVLAKTKLDSAQIAQLKLAEIEFDKFCRQNQIDIYKLDVEDRQGARHLQEVTGSWVPGVLAFIIVSGFFGILVSMMYGILKVSDQQSLLILLGALSAGFGAVLNFYFGSSHGSAQKTALLAKAEAIQ